MRPYELKIAYIDWGDGGKRRPALILHSDGVKVATYAITTQYESKSESIKAKYLVINDWEAAGLNKPSYIDTTRIRRLFPCAIDNAPIGQLSQADITRLLEFIAK